MVAAFHGSDNDFFPPHDRRISTDEQGKTILVAHAREMFGSRLGSPQRQMAKELQAFGLEPAYRVDCRSAPTVFLLRILAKPEQLVDGTCSSGEREQRAP